MILLIGIACLAVACAVLRPDTILGGALHNALIAAPVRLLSGKGFTQVVAGVLVLLFVLSVMMAPELLAVLAISDLTVYFEVVTLAALLGAGTRAKVVFAMVSLPLRWIARALGRLTSTFPPRADGGARRSRRKPTASAKDPDRGWAPAFA